jgi:hypothetical protein
MRQERKEVGELTLPLLQRGETSNPAAMGLCLEACPRAWVVERLSERT